MTEIVPLERIASKIYVIHQIKVMFDSDLAELYGVETGALNRAVKRNIERFPDDFMFQNGRLGYFEMPIRHFKIKPRGET